MGFRIPQERECVKNKKKEVRCEKGFDMHIEKKTNTPPAFQAPSPNRRTDMERGALRLRSGRGGSLNQSFAIIPRCADKTCKRNFTSYLTVS
jgi:hypothetical protein